MTRAPRAIQSVALLIALGGVRIGAAAAPGLVATEAGLFVETDRCAVVRNRGVDTIARVTDADGRVLRYAGTWRGRAGDYLVVRPDGAARIELTETDGDRPDPERVDVQACPDSLPAEAAARLARAMDLRLRGYFGDPVEPDAVDAAFDRALEALDGDAPAAWRAAATFEQAEWLRATGRFGAASRALASAEAGYRTAGNPRGLSDTLRSRGLIAWRQGRLDDAERLFLDALGLLPAEQPGYAHAALFNNLGLVSENRGAQDDALAYYESALNVFQGPVDLRRRVEPAETAALADRLAGSADLASALNTLNNLALLYGRAGQPDVAERYWRNYLAFEAQVPEALAVAQARFNLGVALMNRGRLDDALLMLTRALDRFEAASAGRWRAEALVALGALYMQLGDRDGALAHAGRAASVPIQDARARAHVLRELAAIRRSAGDLAGARDALVEARALLVESGAVRQQARVLGDLARVDLAAGRIADAERRQRRAIDMLADAGFRVDADRSRSHLGEILMRDGRTAEAVRLLEDVLADQRDHDDLLGEFATLERLGEALEAEAPGRAIGFNAEAIRRASSLAASRLPPIRRAGLRGGLRALYDRQVELLLEAGSIEEAWRTAQRARAGGYAELSRHRERDIRSSARNALLDRRAGLLTELHSLSLAVRAGRSDDRDRIPELRRRLDRIETSLQDEAIGTAAVPALSEVRSGLGPERRLLSYYVAGDRAWVFELESAGVRVRAIAEAETLDDRIADLLGRLRQPRTAVGGIERIAGGLAEDLLAPSLADVGELDALLIQPDGPLHSLPFRLLWTFLRPGGEAPTIRRVASLPEVHDAETALHERMLVLADPGWSRDVDRSGAYPDDSLLRRLVRSGSFARLPGSRREAETIAELAGDRVSLDVRTGLAASRPFVMAGGLAGHSLLHVATHGLVDLDYPELSALLLADPASAGPAFLRPAEIASLRIDADLVVLSGCETGVGKVVAGEAAFSLARPFLVAGARRVIASLWKVDDHRTAMFMRRFYRAVFEADASPARALAVAQRQTRADPGTAHPYFWAGFVLTESAAAGDAGTEAGRRPGD